MARSTRGTAGQADWRQLVPGIDPAAKYRPRARIHADNVTSGSHGAEVQWFDASYRYLGQHRIAATTAGTWDTRSPGQLTPPAGTAFAWLLLRSYQAGTYRFDDVALELDRTHAERLQELKGAGFTMASAYGLAATNGRPSLDEVGAAGLKAVYKGLSLFLRTDADAARLTTGVDSVESHPALSLWMGMDEPAWEGSYSCPSPSQPQYGVCPEFVTRAYQKVREVDGA